MLSSYSSISSIQHSPTLGRHQQRSSHYSVRHCIWLRLNVFVADSGKSRVFSDFDWLTIQTAPLARSFSERFHFRVLNSNVILSGFVQSENTCPSLVTKHSTRNHVYSPFCILETYCYFRREGCLRVFGMGYFFWVHWFVCLSLCMSVIGIYHNPGYWLLHKHECARSRLWRLISNDHGRSQGCSGCRCTPRAKNNFWGWLYVGTW